MKPGERIREFRKNKGFTQKEFAEKIDYSQVFLSAIEIGKVEPSREFLKKLNEVFGISSDYILYSDAEFKGVHEPEAEYQALPASIKKLLDNVKEILESKNEAMIDLFKTNTKGILEVIRTNKKRELK